MFFFFKQKAAYEMRISDWSSDVCSSDLTGTKFPASLSFLKKSRPGWTLSIAPPLARAAAQTPEMAWFDCVGSPDKATKPLYSGFSRSAQRSEQSRVGKEILRTGRSRWSPYTYKKKENVSKTQTNV